MSDLAQAAVEEELEKFHNKDVITLFGKRGVVRSVRMVHRGLTKVKYVAKVQFYDNTPMMDYWTDELSVVPSER